MFLDAHKLYEYMSVQLYISCMNLHPCGLLQLHWTVCVYINAYVCMQAYYQTDLPETDGPGALHTHVGALLMAVDRSLRVCSVAGVFLPASVRRESVLLSAVTGLGAAGPDGIRQRSASRGRGENTQTSHKREEGTQSFMAFFYRDAAEVKVIYCRILCFLFCLFKEALIFLKGHCVILCGCIHF